MVDSEICQTNQYLKPPLPKPPGRNCTNQTKPVRHVVFCEIPPKHQKPTKERQRRSFSGFHVCCAWACMAVFALILILLLVAAIFTSFLQAKMPEVRLDRVSIPRLDVVTSLQKSLLFADVDIVIGVSNKNERVELSYGPMTVDVSSENINLGQTKVVGFSQPPKNMTVLNIHTRVTKSAIDKEDGAFLKSSLKNEEMIIDVVLTGAMGLNVEGFKMNGLPVTVTCEDIELSVVDLGQDPKCSVKMFDIRTVFN